MGISGRFYELNVYAYGRAALLHATFEDVGDAELPRDLRQIFGRALVVLRRCARDHFQIGNPGEAGQDFILDAVGKVGVGFVFAQVLERKDRDRFQRNLRQARQGGGTRRFRPVNEKIRSRGEGGDEQRGDHEARSSGQFRGRGLRFSGQAEFGRLFRVAEFPRVEIDQGNAQPVFHFTFAEVVQVRTPLRKMLEVISDVFGEEDVPGIAAIHDALRDVNCGAGHARLLVHVDNAADRPAVHTHAQFEIGMFLERAADFEGTFRRLFGAVVENQRHAIAGRNLEQAAGGFRTLKFLRVPNDLNERIAQGALLANQPLRVTDDVGEQDVRDLKLKFSLKFAGHLGRSRTGKASLGDPRRRVVAVAGDAFGHHFSLRAVAGDATGDARHEHIAR